MKTTQITPDLVQLTFLSFSNCYLLRDGDGLTLVDCTLPGKADAILGVAKKLGGTIRRIALTHAHGDHIGSLDELAKKLGNVEVAISSRDARLLRKDFTMDPGEPKTKLKGSYPGAVTQPTIFLQENDLVGSLYVIATPGHTPGHVCFLDSRDGTLFAGDAFQRIGGELRVVTDPPWFFPLAKMATWEPEIAKASARKFQTRNVTRVVSGHGAGVADADELSAALQHAEA